MASREYTPRKQVRRCVRQSLGDLSKDCGISQRLISCGAVGVGTKEMTLAGRIE